MKSSKLFGLHSVQAALDYSPKKIHQAWVDSGRQDKRLTQAIDDLGALGIVPEKVDRKRLDRLADNNNHQGIVIAVEMPGELTESVIITKDNATGITPTVCTVASGAAEPVPVYQVTNLARTLRWLKGEGLWIMGAAGETAQTVYTTDFTIPMALVVGTEGKGLRRLTKEQCDVLVSVPMLGQVESLNLSVATGVLLYEAVRQRLLTA